MQDFEKLGVFYLGREYDLGKKQLQDNLLLYDSRDLVTHAVVVGMTGSGKTGLCIDLIEEAAIDNVPSILIDPKGDLTESIADISSIARRGFLAWVNPMTPAARASPYRTLPTQQASLWQKGLGEWGQSGERIQRLRDAAEFVDLYTRQQSRCAGV